MKRLFGLCLLALLITTTLAACSTQKSSGISDPDEVESAGDAAPARPREAAVSQEEPNPEGEIDLELGSDDGEGEGVVIENATPAGERRFGASTVDEGTTCEAASDCGEMEILKCPGERFCEESKCVYRCYASEEVVLEESEDDSEGEDGP